MPTLGPRTFPADAEPPSGFAPLVEDPPLPPWLELAEVADCAKPDAAGNAVAVVVTAPATKELVSSTPLPGAGVAEGTAAPELANVTTLESVALKTVWAMAALRLTRSYTT